jgi:UDPglucose 6-dehydrogenase
MNVTIIGTGYVGLVTGVGFAEFGVNTVCVDKDAERIARLSRGELPIHEPRLGEMLQRSLAEGRLRFTTDAEAAVRGSLVVFIAVGTPPREDGSADLDAVDAVARMLGRCLDGYKVVVTKSTVPVGTGRRIQRIIRETANGASPSFDIAANPEFLREGSAVEDFLRPSRVVIGADSPHAAAILADLYRPLYLIETPVVVTTLETAELIKYATNGFLALKISMINELAALCEPLGVDVHTVARALGLDPRIGPKFLHPGPGFGGSCFPKDTRALAEIGKTHGRRLRLVETVIDVNEAQKARMVTKIADALGRAVEPGGLTGLTIGALGLAFKPNTDDVREAPALAILQRLADLGATVQAYDPAAMENARAVLPDITYHAEVDGAAEGADALVVFTEWNQFRNLDLARIRPLVRRPVLVDLRNIWDPDKARELGFTYHGVGRGGPSAPVREPAILQRWPQTSMTSPSLSSPD